jgi:hypothetical protein
MPITGNPLRQIRQVVPGKSGLFTAPLSGTEAAECGNSGAGVSVAVQKSAS